MPKLSVAVGVVAGALLVGATIPAPGAMRSCMRNVVGQATAKSELEAKKQAMDDWKKSAIEAGLEHPAWRIAGNKSFTCETEADGQVTCTASGEPCTIVQVPPSTASN